MSRSTVAGFRLSHRCRGGYRGFHLFSWLQDSKSDDVHHGHLPRLSFFRPRRQREHDNGVRVARVIEERNRGRYRHAQRLKRRRGEGERIGRKLDQPSMMSSRTEGSGKRTIGLTREIKSTRSTAESKPKGWRSLGDEAPT